MQLLTFGTILFRTCLNQGAAWWTISALAATIYMTSNYMFHEYEHLEGVIYRLRSNPIVKSTSWWEFAENLGSQLWGGVDAIVRSQCRRSARNRTPPRRHRVKATGSKVPTKRWRQLLIINPRKSRQRRTKSNDQCNFTAMSAIMAMSAARLKPRRIVRFDSDSKRIRIDNCASFCISNDPTDFITTLKPVKKKLKGLGGTLTKVQSGTIQWDIEDDLGQSHRIIIPNSLYVPDSPSRLLSPQHWAQESRDIKPNPRGTWCATYRDKVVLYWGQRKFTRTIAIDRESSNVATFYTASKYAKYIGFCAECEGADHPELFAMNVHAVSDDEDEGASNIPVAEVVARASREAIATEVNEDWPGGQTSPQTFDFDARQPSTAIVEEEEVDTDNRNERGDAMTEFAHVHQQLGHLPPAKIQRMAMEGFLPKRLATCPIPACCSCLYGQAARRPWRKSQGRGPRPANCAQPYDRGNV